MLTRLVRCNDIGLRLDRARLQQRFPVLLPGVWEERGRIQQDFGAFVHQDPSKLWETQVEADHAADAADGRVERLVDLVSRGDDLVFSHARPAGDVDFEQMDLGVTMLDFSLGVDPQEVVHDSVFEPARFVNGDRYVDAMLFGGITQASHKWRFFCGFAKGLRLFSVESNVVCSLWEEDDLYSYV